jgi:beta-lactamase class A
MSMTSRPLDMSGAGFGCGRYRLDMTLDAPAGTADLPVDLRSTGVTWSIHVRSLTAGVTFGLDDVAVLSTASVGKLLLLAEVARRIDEGSLLQGELLTRTPADAVADSGLWQHLATDSFTVGDVSVLVAAVSDNLATNVLLRRVGVDAMDQVAQALGFEGVRLHDFVRDVRRASDPPRLSSGSARELAGYFARIASGEIISPEVSGMLAGWLGLSTDLSMVASSLDLDPLAHAAGGHALSLMNKTGTDAGVRADCGLVSCGGVKVAYAAIANWDEASVPMLDPVMADMRAIGGFVRSLVEIDGPRVSMPVVVNRAIIP